MFCIESEPKDQTTKYNAWTLIAFWVEEKNNQKTKNQKPAIKGHVDAWGNLNMDYMSDGIIEL